MFWIFNLAKLINNKSYFIRIIILIIEFYLFEYENNVFKINNKFFFNRNKEENFRSKNISIIIPVYNCEKTINFSISSIQRQNFTSFEIILIYNIIKYGNNY